MSEFGLSGIILVNMAIIMIKITIKLKLTTILHLRIWLVLESSMMLLTPNTTMNPMMTKSCPKMPNTPRLLIYFGDNSRTYTGISSKSNPVTTPCKNLITNNTTKFCTCKIGCMTMAITDRIRVIFLKVNQWVPS
jgi:hypothetical protein